MLLEKQTNDDCDIYATTQLCLPSKFRTPDGTCNNAQNSNWGSRGDAFLRIIPSKYADGQSTPRESSDPIVPLPHPKTIAEIIKNINIPLKENSDLSLLFALWGQLITDDISKIYTLDDSKECCGKDKNDKTYCYALQGDHCRDYKRTAPSRLNFTCEFGMKQNDDE